MNFSLKKIKSNKLAYIFILIAIIVFCFTITNFASSHNSYSEGLSTVYSSDVNGNDEWHEQMEQASSEFEGNVKKGVLYSVMDWINSFILSLKYRIGTFIVNEMVDDFSPTFSTWSKLEHGKRLSAEEISLQGTGIDILNLSYADFQRALPGANMIFHAAKVIGLTISTILVVVNLYLCIFGQANAIRTNVIRILAMYAISLLCITIGYKIILAFSSIMDGIWQLIVFYQGEPIDWYYFDGGLSLLFTLAADVSLFVVNPVFLVIVGVISLFLIWKPLKGFFRMYCQIIEYYLIYMILLFMFPAIIPTIIAPSTSGIFKAYVRMLFTETILLILSCVLMKVFVIFLVSGTMWASIANYIAILAFIKVSQNLQQYASSMGLNSVQASGNFAQICGNGFGNLLRNVMNMSRLGSTVGSNMKNIGLATNNENVFRMGATIASPIEAAVNKNPANGDSFNSYIGEAFAKQRAVRAGGFNSVGFNDYSSLEEAHNGTLTHRYDAIINEHCPKGVSSIRHFENGTVEAKAKNGEVITVNKDLTVHHSDNGSVSPEASNSRIIGSLGAGGYFARPAAGVSYTTNADGNAVFPYEAMEEAMDVAQLEILSPNILADNAISNESVVYAQERKAGSERPDGSGHMSTLICTCPAAKLDAKTVTELKEKGFKMDKDPVISGDSKCYVFRKEVDVKSKKKKP